MRRVSDILYRFRGLVLALMAALLLVTPSLLVSFPKKFSYLSRDEFIGISCIYLAAFIFYAYGILLRIRSRQYIGQHTRGSKHEAGELVTAGPYAYCRHPLYTSNTSIALGAIFLYLDFNVFNPGIYFIIAIFVFEYLLARAEDRFLEGKFGDTWRVWAQKTPIFPYNPAVLFPKKIPAPKRTFLQAFKADASTWVWFVIFNLTIVAIKIFTEYCNV